MNFFVLVKLKVTVSLEDMIVSSIKSTGRFPKAIDMSGTLKNKSLNIHFDVVNTSRQYKVKMI